MTYVDERIVDMEFNNKQFETAAAQTMSTLDKLKEKLSFKNASSGVDQLQKAVNGINVNPIVQGLDNIENKMSILSIAGKRAVENIVDWAMSGLHKIESKLNVFNQIITGGKSRAQNIEQAKFQLEGLGVAWSDIQEDINYGVQDTAYGLDAAAKVASQLVASQVELGDEMKHALLGISGVAAMTNSSYEDIGRIYTTVAGNGRLMGDQLLQLSSRGINAAAQLAKVLNTTEEEVRDMVSKGKISFQMFSDAMFESFGEHAKSANKTFQGALSNTKAALSRLGADIAAQGFDSIRDILNEIIPKLKEFKKRIKPIEDGIIKLIDVVGKLVEEFVKAIDIEKIVDRIIPKMTSFIETAVDWVTAYKQVFTGQDAAVRGGTAFYYEQQALKGITDSVKEATEAQMKLTDVTDDQIRIANEIWYQGLHGTGEARREELGSDYEAVQFYIDKMIELGWDEAKMQEEVAKTAEEEQIAIENLAKTEKKRDFINKIKIALQNLKTVGKNVFESLKNVISVAFDSLGKSFKSDGVLGGIIDLTGAFARISEKFKITKDRAEKLRPIFNVIFGIAKLLGKAIVIVAKGLATVITYIDKFITKIKNNKTINKIFDATKNAINAVGSAIKDLWDKLKNSGVWDKFVEILGKVGTFLGEVLVGALNVLADVAGGISGGLSAVFEWLGEKVQFIKDKLNETFPFLQNLKDFFKEDILSGSWIENLKELFGEIFGGTKDVFNKAYNFAKEVVDGLIAGFQSISLEDMLKASKIVGAIITFGTIIKWLNSLANLNNSVSDLAGGFNEFLDGLVSTLKKYGHKLDAESFSLFADGIIKIVGAIIALVVVMALVPNAREVAGEAARIVEVLMLLYGVIFVAKAWMLKTKGALATVQIKTVRLQMAALFLGVAAVIYAVAKSIKEIYGIMTSPGFDTSSFITALTIIGGSIVVVVAILKGIIRQVEDRGGTLAVSGIAGLFTGMSTMIYVISIALRKISDLLKDENNHVWGAFGIVTLFLIELGVMIGALLAITKGNTVINNPFKGLMTTFLAISALIYFGIVPLLQAVHNINDEGDEDTIKQVGIIIGMLGLVVVGMMTLANAVKTADALAAAAIPVSIGAMLMMLSYAFKTFNDVGVENVKKISITIGVLIGALMILITVLMKFSGGAISMLALAAVFVGFGVGLFFAAEGVNSLLDAFERLVGYLATAASFIVDTFKKLKNAIKGLFSTKNDYGDVDFSEMYGYGPGSKSDEEVPAESKGQALNYDELLGLKESAESKAVEAADYQYIAYKAKYYEELNKKSTEDPVIFTPNPTVETTDKAAKERDDLVAKVAASDAEKTSENYNNFLQDSLDSFESTANLDSFWDPSYYSQGIDSIDVGEGTTFNFDDLKNSFTSGLSGSDITGTIENAYGNLFSSDGAGGTLSNIMNQTGLGGGDALVNGITDYLNTNNGQITEAVGLSMDNVTSAMQSKNNEVQEAAKIVPETALNTALSYENEFYKAGVMLYTGFAEGLTDEEPKKLTVKNISDVIFNAETALRKAAEIKSPSKLFAKLGNFVTLGFAQGILQLSGAAESATEDIAEDSTDSLRGVLNRIFDTTMSGLDTNPKITPVLDLSQLEEGLGQMNGMMSSNNTFGLAFGAASAYNTSLANRNAAFDISEQYDGTNVVEAVGELRTDIDDLKALIGNLGFYVDGRQMATAIANPMNKALNDITVRTGRGVQ